MNIKWCYKYYLENIINKNEQRYRIKRYFRPNFETNDREVITNQIKGIFDNTR